MTKIKYGFRIVIHKDIPNELLNEAKSLCDKFIELACRGHIYRNHSGKWIQQSKSYGNGGWRSYWKRGRFGLLSDSKKLVFRRLSNNRRIFGVVLTSNLTNVNINQCICPSHLGSEKVKMIDGPYNEEKYITITEIGEIKG